MSKKDKHEGAAKVKKDKDGGPSKKPAPKRKSKDK